MSKKMVAQLIVETLENAGVKHCYGIVGDTLNFITHAMQNSKIKWVHMRHEEAGGFAAGAESFMSGHLTACAGSCGPGSLHFINGLFESQKNRAPVILIASQIATPNIGLDFPQEVDFLSVYKGWTVFCEQVKAPEQAQQVMTMAIQTAINQKGVAVVIVPVDISKAIIDSQPAINFPQQSTLSASNAELKEVAQHLNQGKRVGIYAGIGAKNAHDELIALAKKLNAPIAHTTRAKDFIEYDNPFNMGMAGILGTKAAGRMLQECDTILLAGNDFAWGQFLYPSTATIIQIDVDAAHLGRRCPINLGVTSDLKAALAGLLPLIETKTDRAFLDQCLVYRKETVDALRKAEEPTSDGKLIRPQYLAKLLSEYADEDAIFVADAGSPMVWLARHIDVNGKRRTLSSYRHGTMANAMPQALGLQKTYPDRQVITLSGDGGLTMLLGDILTTRQEALPIKIVVFNNSALDFVEIEQKQEGLPAHYTDLKNPDFVQLAKAIGISGLRVEKADELEAAVKQFLAQTGPALLDVVVDPNEAGL